MWRSNHTQLPRCECLTLCFATAFRFRGMLPGHSPTHLRLPAETLGGVNQRLEHHEVNEAFELFSSSTPCFNIVTLQIDFRDVDEHSHLAVGLTTHPALNVNELVFGAGAFDENDIPFPLVPPGFHQFMVEFVGVESPLAELLDFNPALRFLHNGERLHTTLRIGLGPEVANLCQTGCRLYLENELAGSFTFPQPLGGDYPAVFESPVYPLVAFTDVTWAMEPSPHNARVVPTRVGEPASQIFRRQLINSIRPEAPVFTVFLRLPDGSMSSFDGTSFTRVFSLVRALPREFQDLVGMHRIPFVPRRVRVYGSSSLKVVSLSRAICLNMTKCRTWTMIIVTRDETVHAQRLKEGSVCVCVYRCFPSPFRKRISVTSHSLNEE